MMVEVWASTEFHLHDDEEQHRESGENGDLSVAASSPVAKSGQHAFINAVTTHYSKSANSVQKVRF